jgi:CheY-like chemotaxis protein
MKTEGKSGREKDRASQRVLVVEDSPVNLQLALMQLRSLGYAADSASNGREALTKLEGTRYDVILMDCQMPEMDGFEATWQIRNREEQGGAETGEVAPIQIIAMTADASEDSREKCLAAGMNDYIRKPVQLPELEVALDRASLGPGAGQPDEVLDPLVLAGLRLLRQPGRPDPVLEIIALFMEDAPERLAAIEAAARANDMWSMSKIVAAATNLRGSASNLGARQLAMLCGQMETAARQGALDEVGQLLGQAREELQRVRLALDRVE